MEEEFLEVCLPVSGQYNFGEEFDQFKPWISVCCCECKGNVASALHN